MQASNVVSGHAVKAQCHSFLASTLDGDGQLDAPVALPQTRPPCDPPPSRWPHRRSERFIDEKQSLASAEIRTPDRPGLILVTIPTELPRLPHSEP